MTDYTALKAELQRYAPLVPLCADALAAIEELERDAKRWRSSAAPAPEPVAWRPLTDEDRRSAIEAMPDWLGGFLKKWGWLNFAKEIERRCMEKNKAAPQPAQAEEEQ